MLPLYLLILGVFSVTAGVALLSVPAALIVVGCAVVAFALFWDFDA